VNSVHSHASIGQRGGVALARHEHVAAGAHDHGGTSGWRAAAMVTLHCLTGCLIGEWSGLAIGVALSLPTGLTVVLATVLAYTSGFGLTMWPLLRRGMRLWPALTTVFVGEGCWAAT